MDHDRRHLKAAKALVIVIPLFGFTNILTIMGPSDVGLKLFKEWQNVSCHSFIIVCFSPIHLKFNAHLSLD